MKMFSAMDTHLLDSRPLKSWITSAEGSQFPLENIPFGVFVNPIEKKPACCTSIGDKIVDLGALEQEGLFGGPVFSRMPRRVFCEGTLNKFMEEGSQARVEARETIQLIFVEGSTGLPEPLKAKVLFDEADVEMLMPVFIRDYTDFYSSKNHAYNVGVMFRGPENALQPNWLHLPVGYHGRASSIVVSGTPIRRPKG